jgi:hypothetical protein
MKLFLLTRLLVAPIVVVLGDLRDLRRPFANHNYGQLTTRLLSPHNYGQFTAELLSHGYSNITFEFPGNYRSGLAARQECANAGYGTSSFHVRPFTYADF